MPVLGREARLRRGDPSLDANFALTLIMRGHALYPSAPTAARALWKQVLVEFGDADDPLLMSVVADAQAALATS